MTILFSASNYDAGFILTDIYLLRQLDKVQLLRPSPFPRVWEKLKEIPRADFVYGWFADLPNLDTGLICRLLRKRFVLAIGGYELASLPEIGYGLQRRRLTRLVVGACIRSAHTLVVLHRGLLEEARRLYPEDGHKARVVHPGYDTSLWFPDPTVRRSSVSSVISSELMPRFRAKGGPAVLEVARRFPDLDVMIVGVAPNLQAQVREGAPPNVRFVHRLPQEELRKIYQRSLACLQFSVREVFPNAVAEAMLCGCVPVVSPLPVMREVVGDSGFVAKSTTVDSFAEALDLALVQADGLRKRARDRIVAAYPMEKRLTELRKALFGS